MPMTPEMIGMAIISAARVYTRWRFGVGNRARNTDLMSRGLTTPRAEVTTMARPTTRAWPRKGEQHMDRGPDQEATSSTVTRRQLLKSGAGLALLWSFPVISTIGARSAYASGSVTCDGAHDAPIAAVGEGCTKDEAKHALK